MRPRSRGRTPRGAAPPPKWDAGGGATGHPFNPDTRPQAVNEIKHPLSLSSKVREEGQPKSTQTKKSTRKSLEHQGHKTTPCVSPSARMVSTQGGAKRSTCYMNPTKDGHQRVARQPDPAYLGATKKKSLHHAGMACVNNRGPERLGRNCRTPRHSWGCFLRVGFVALAATLFASAPKPRDKSTTSCSFPIGQTSPRLPSRVSIHSRVLRTQPSPTRRQTEKLAV